MPLVHVPAACILGALLQAAAGSDAPTTAFCDVTLVPMDRPGVLEHATVLVAGDRITAVGAAATVSVPNGATRIECAGLWLMPGLIDDHVHLFDARDLVLDLANGVTTVRNLKGAPWHLELRAAVARGELLGPRVLTSGPFVNEPDVRTPDEAEAAVRDQAERGYDCVKIHGPLSMESFERLVAVAEEVGLPVVGHVPRNQLLADVLAVGGLQEIAHAEELLYTHFDPLKKSFDPREIPAVVALCKAAGVHVTPTLVAYGGIADQVEDLDRVLARPQMRYVPPIGRLTFGPALNKYKLGMSAADVPLLRRSREFQARLVKALHAGGVPILLGTDAMNPAVIPGFAIVTELENLVDAGLSPWDALAAGTVRAGAFLGGSPPPGQVAVGAAADLVLLDADPLADVGNVTRLRGVMARGRWLPKARLDEELERVIASYAAEEPLVPLIRTDDAAPLLARVRALPRTAGAPAPLDENFLNSLGLLYMNIRAPRLAEAVFAANVELHPDSTRAQNRLAEARASR